MTDDNLGGFRAPLRQPVTPPAVKAAGARLMQFALEHNISADVAIVDMPIPDELSELQRDQRLVTWYSHVLADG